MATTAIAFHSHTHRRPPIHCYLVTLSHPKPQSLVSTATQHRRRYLSSIYLSDRVRLNRDSIVLSRVGEPGGEGTTEPEEEVNNVGVKAALSMLKFYKSIVFRLARDFNVDLDLIPLDGLTKKDRLRNDYRASLSFSTADLFYRLRLVKDGQGIAHAQMFLARVDEGEVLHIPVNFSKDVNHYHDVSLNMISCGVHV
ncbi:hypothetical protein AKJ16_DCAP15618 [Drosera capensis]